MPNFKLTLCYDGSRYHGWQRQGNTEGTIQERMETLLSRLLQQPIELAASGRTDAGVHARRQVCSFRADTKTSPDDLLLQLRKYLPEDVGAISLEIAPPRFHARLSCREKTYVYRIWNSGEPQVFDRKYRLAVPEALDLTAMCRAGKLLCGKHDFAAFCSAKNSRKSSVRDLRSVEILQDGNELRLIFTSDGFLYNMVRILTGTLLQVGRGERSPEEIPAVLASLDRSQTGPLAPAHGLFLWEVRY